MPAPAAARAPAPPPKPYWVPWRWAGESTLDLRTNAPGEEPHWFPVWLVVLDNQLYVRLGNRAVARLERNTTQRIVGVRIAGNEFGRVRAEPVPDMAPRVAAAMAGKYWFDVVARQFDHPLTLRLVPE